MVSETIEFVLWYEREIYIALADKGEGNRQGGTTGGNGSGHMKVSDPTAVQALRNLQEINVLDVPYGAAIGLNKRWQETYRLRNPLKWLQVGKALKQHYLSDTNSLHEFFERRYIKKEDWKQTCKELHISKDIYYVMRADVIRAGEVYAAGMGAASTKKIL